MQKRGTEISSLGKGTEDTPELAGMVAGRKWSNEAAAEKVITDDTNELLVSRETRIIGDGVQEKIEPVIGVAGVGSTPRLKVTI